MAKKPTVIIEIEDDGATKISVNGVAGKSCQDLTKKLEAALGNVTEDKPTAEMYQRKEAARVENRS